MTFKKGMSGNPRGRKRGVPDRRAQARELFAARKDELIEVAINLALAGDQTALRMCLDRVVPALKPAGAPVTLPALPVDLAGKGERVLEQLAAGAITPDEAATIISVIATQARVVETSELVQRIVVLEEKASAKSS